MSLNTRKRNWPYIVVCAVLLLLLSTIFLSGVLFNPGRLFVRDFIFPNTPNFPLGTWNSTTSSPNLELNKIPISLLFVAGYHLLGSSLFINLFQLLTLFLVGFIPLITIFYIVRKHTALEPSRAAVVAFIPAAVYLINPWVQDRINNDLFMVLGMAFTPLFFYLCYQAFDNSFSWQKSIAAAGCLAFLSMLSSHDIFYWVPLTALLILLMLFFGKGHRKSIVMSVMAFGATYIALSAFWILPLLIKSKTSVVQPSYNLNLDSIYLLSTRNTPLDILNLSGGGAWKDTLQTATLPMNLGVVVGLFIIILALLGLYAGVRKKPVAITAIFLIVLMLLSMGTNAPLPVFQWFYDSPLRPIVWLYRDPSRFIQFLLVAVLVLVAYATYRLQEIVEKVRYGRMLFWFGACLILLLLLVSPASYSLLQADDGTLMSSNPPKDYPTVSTLLQNSDTSGKALWLPVRGYYFYNWNQASDVAGDFYTTSSPIPTYTLNTSAGSAAAMNEYIYQKIILEDRTENMGILLSRLNIKYAVVHTDLTGWQNLEALRVADILSNQKDLMRVYHSNNYQVFKNLDYRDNTVSSVSEKDIGTGNVRTLPQVAQKDVVLDSNSWQVSPGSELSKQQNMYKWRVNIAPNVNTYSATYNYVGKVANFNPYDEINFSLFPSKSNSGNELSVIVQTANSSFTFNRYDLKLGSWNNLSLNLRAADEISKGNGQPLGLNNVKNITFNIYQKTKFGKYYHAGNNSFFLKNLQLTFDNTYGNYSPSAVVDMFNDIQPSYVSYIKRGNSYDVTNASNLDHNGELLFAESYDSAWRLVINDKGKTFEVKPKPYYGVINAFPLQGIPVGAKLTIDYKTDQSYKLGIIISGTALTACACYLIYIRITTSTTWRAYGWKGKHRK